MSSITINGVRFISYSNDHNPPHVDVLIDGMKMKILLGIDGEPPRIERVNPRIKDVDIRRAFRICCENHEAMIALWEKVHGEID